MKQAMTIRLMQCVPSLLRRTSLYLHHFATISSVVHVSKKLAFRNIQRSVVYTSIQREGESTGSILSLVLPGRGWMGRGNLIREGKKIKKGGRASPAVTKPDRKYHHAWMYARIFSLCCLWSVVQYGSMRQEKLTQREHRAPILGQRVREAGRQRRGRILGRNWDKSFPPCYSQSPLLTDFYSPLPPWAKVVWNWFTM